jgi:hypothetical protein
MAEALDQVFRPDRLVCGVDRRRAHCGPPPRNRAK